MSHNALYFGCYGRIGHGLYRPDGRSVGHFERISEGFPWDSELLDTGLLRNGKISDRTDGRVFWTCGGSPLWIAFFWWDRSFDSRPNSNSGFYVQGFDFTERKAAFQYACEAFPTVVTRQEFPLVLQDRW